MSAPYADAAPLYLAAGWSSPIPLGARGERAVKHPVPKGYTGRAAKVPTEADVEKWAASHAVNNVALHLVAGVIGIDVDHYGTKTGADVLAALEAELGPLPPTVRSTARGWDNPSGIRFYTVPPEIELVGKLSGGIEIIQAHHRYAVVWPSVHPDTGEVYEWWAPNGAPLGRPPRRLALPPLPQAWADHLSTATVGGSALARGAATPSLGLHRDEAVIWLREHGAGRPCRAVRGVLRKQLAAIEKAVEDGTSRYDTAVEGSWALIQLAAEGHRGVSDAVKEFGLAYRSSVENETGRDKSEWSRMVTDGVGKAAALVVEQEGADPEFGSWEQHPDGACPERDGRLWPSPNAPLDVAERYVQNYRVHDGLLTLKRWRGQFYVWAGRHYEPVSEEQITADLSTILRDAEFMGSGATPQVLGWKPTPTKINAVVKMLPAVRLGEGRASVVLVPDSQEADDGRDGRVSLTNGVLDLEHRVLTPHTPARFNLTSLGFDWAPEGVPRRIKPWVEFLDSLDIDEGTVRLLSQWFGYVLSGETRLQKALLVIGPPRSGKGTVARVLTALIGQEFTASPSLKAWGGQFALAQFLGKTSAIVTDADASAKAAAEAVEDLKRITGEDSVSVPRKYLGDWTGKLGVRFTLLANNSPAFLDTSGALARRFVPVRLTETFLGREDTSLSDRLVSPEVLSAVFVWALDGLDDLKLAGSLTVPKASRELAKAMVEDFSPVQTFLNDRCEVRPKPEAADDFVSRKTVYAAWCAWCAEQGRAATNMSTFARDLRSVLPRVMGSGNARVLHGGSKARVFYGITVLDAEPYEL